MNLKFNKICLSFLMVSLVTIISISNAAAIPKTITPEEIKPGMKGYGLTVFKGSVPEKFEVEVVDVVPNFLVKQDIILIKCHHPITDSAGVIGGMSGSPIYINGRLAGALAYGWNFSKEALAGVTPIGNMYKILERKIVKEKKYNKISSLKNPVQYVKDKLADSFFGHFKNEETQTSNLIPVRTPISISGFEGAPLDLLKKSVEPFAMDTVMGGGNGTYNDDVKDTFSEGDAIGVQLISGDLSATGIGTVTAVEGKSVLAFGHPMFNMGQSFLPVTTARIHTVVSSLARSNKMGSPVKEIASLVQDRGAGIMARTDMSAPVIPVKLFIEDTSSKNTFEYNVKVADRQWLAGKFIHAAILQFINHAASDAADVTAKISGKIKIEGRPVYTLEDSGVSRTGLAPLLNYFRPSAVVDAILNNPFENVKIEWIEYRVKLYYGLSFAVLSSVYLTSQNPAAGEIINLNIGLTDFGGNEKTVTVPVKIPENSEGNKLKITIGGGDNIDPPMASPENLDDLLRNIRLYYPAGSLVVSLEVEGQGVALRGEAFNQLPASVVLALKPVSGSEDVDTFESLNTQIIKTDTIISGKKSITFTAGRRKNR
ncbi:MAG: hypothetical protein JXR91_04960 [Deltaproteobacteria bacterium]|nr:hypothetical protein [Deltaproteobacteria bacterium]